MFADFIKWLKNLFKIKEEIGKEYSFAEYIDIVSKYTDSTILKETEDHNHYTGGDCTVKVIDDESVRFNIRMYFINDNNERIMKTSERLLSLKNFDSETRAYFREGEKTFEVLMPERDK